MIDNKFDLILEIKMFLEDDKEFMKVKPSYYFLNSYAPKLLELIETWKKLDSEIHDSLCSVKRKIDIFRVDLAGELKHDYEKGNKRYRDKWIVQKDNIDNLKEVLIKIWKDKYKTQIKNSTQQPLI
jgi:hypothetical protein